MNTYLAKNPWAFGTLDVCNPYNNAILQTLNCDNEHSVREAIGVADTYDYRLTAWQRYDMLQRFSNLLLQQVDSFAQLISLESGKTLKDARAEVHRAHQAFLLSAEEAKRINGEVMPIDAVAGVGKGVAMIVREPIGIVTAITPFNYPLNLVAHKVGPALAANNPVIVKPSEQTPLTALKMHKLLIEAGVPPEMLHVVVGSPVELVEVLCTDPRVRKISFTGSVSVGKSIHGLAGMKSISMELGGNDPMIILDDADLDLALSAAVDGAYGNNGERCTSVKRFVIQESIADQFIERFVSATKTLLTGDQTDPETDVGPLIDVQAAKRIEDRINASIAFGARIRCGGKRHGACLQPTVMDYVTTPCPVVQTETFGPVAPFIRVANLAEAIRVANETPYGLQSGVFTSNLDSAMQAARSIQAGGVMINKAPGFRAEHLPFGGIKDSGMGREGIRFAVESMTQLKTIVL